MMDNEWIKAFEGEELGNTIIVYKDYENDRPVVKAAYYLPGKGKVIISTVNCDDEHSQHRLFELTEEDEIFALVSEYLRIQAKGANIH